MSMYPLVLMIEKQNNTFVFKHSPMRQYYHNVENWEICMETIYKNLQTENYIQTNTSTTFELADYLDEYLLKLANGRTMIMMVD